MTLYTAGYRDANDARRLPPEAFYGSLPEEAVVVDIRGHPYSPFAPAYTGSGVEHAVAAMKPGRTETFGLRELGNTRRDPSGKRVNPPLYRDPDAGFARLGAILEEYGGAVIFCACSLSTYGDSLHRCHRFAVAEEMQRRYPGLNVVHLPLGAQGNLPLEADV
ncbi:MAG TPA: hypothetical protein VGM37_09965 [Armatimonadota bacterium]|jgi:hypothetical protein